MTRRYEEQWYVPDKWRLSLHNYAPELRERYDFQDKIGILDCTLREGLETPGIVMTLNEKIKVAQALEDIGIKEIECGSPARLPAQYELVKAIKKETGLETFAAQSTRDPNWKQGIDICVEAGADHIDILGTARANTPDALDKTISRCVEMIEYAKGRGVHVEIGSTGATNTPLENLSKYYNAAIDAGVWRFTYYDSGGCITPEASANLITKLRKAIKDRVPIKVHHHNDIGFATACTIADLAAGASYCDLTVNGLGDRAGNAALEEVACILKMAYGVDIGIQLDKLWDLSRFVEKLCGIKSQPNKAYIGRNAFIHESAQHAIQILRGAAKPLAGETYNPAIVGAKREVTIGPTSLTEEILTYRLGMLELTYTNQQVATIGDKVRAVIMERKTNLTLAEFDNILREICE